MQKIQTTNFEFEQLDFNESNPYFQLGYLSSTCKGAIRDMQTFIDLFSEELSETQIYCLKNSIERIKKGLEIMDK
jgi:hypothetical protein